MTFTPGPMRVHFEPMRQVGVLKSVDGDVIESGKVISVGEGVSFLGKPGDVVNFLRWGAEENTWKETGQLRARTRILY